MMKFYAENEEQEHAVSMLLAKIQGYSVDVYSDIHQDYVTSTDSLIDINAKYRLTQTPLKISKEIWRLISPIYKYAVLFECGIIYFYEKEPTVDEHFNWEDKDCGESCKCPFDVDVTGVKWYLSLTKRPDL